MMSARIWLNADEDAALLGVEQRQPEQDQRAGDAGGHVQLAGLRRAGGDAVAAHQRLIDAEIEKPNRSSLRTARPSTTRAKPISRASGRIGLKVRQNRPTAAAMMPPAEAGVMLATPGSGSAAES